MKYPIHSTDSLKSTYSPELYNIFRPWLSFKMKNVKFCSAGGPISNWRHIFRLKYPFPRFSSQKLRKNPKFSQILAFLDFRKRDLFQKWNISQKTDFDSVEVPQNGLKRVIFPIFGRSCNFRPPTEQKSALLSFKDNQGHNILRKFHEISKPQTIWKCSKVSSSLEE